MRPLMEPCESCAGNGIVPHVKRDMEKLKRGEIPEIKDFDDHEMYAKATLDMLANWQIRGNPEIYAMATDYLRQRLQLAAERRMQATPPVQGAPPGMDAGAMPPGGVPTGAPMPQGQPQPGLPQGAM